MELMVVHVLVRTALLKSVIVGYLNLQYMYVNPMLAS